MRRAMHPTLLCLALAGCAAAQDDSPLGGPSVSIEPAAPTLVERDLEGRLRPLDARAEVAALGLLGLTDAEREKVDALVLERAALVDRIVFDNLELLTQIQSAQAAMQGNERPRPDDGQRDLFWKMIDTIAPLRAQEPLVDHYAAALPETARERYRALVSEWNDAQADEAAADPSRPQRARPRAAGFMRGSDIAGIRTELRAAYERGAADRAQQLDALLARLGLTPEQEGEVRAMIRAFGETHGGNPTQAQRARLFRDILTRLEPEQRRRAIEAVRGDR